MSARIYVGNVSYQATVEDLEELFGTCGPLKDCFLVTNKETGKLRGFAFVEYKVEADAQQALRSLNDVELLGRPLTVKEAAVRRYDHANDSSRS